MNGLKLIRTRCDYTIMDVAKKLGVSKQAVSAWENGKKEIPEARKRQLAAVFGLDESFFITDRSEDERVQKLSCSDEFVQRKQEQKLLEDRIHRSLEGPEHLNIKDQIDYFNNGSLLYRRFIDVVNLLYSQKYSEKMDYHTRILENLDGMILAMGGQINLHRDVDSSRYNEKIENVETVRNMFERMLADTSKGEVDNMQVMFPTSSLDGIWNRQFIHDNDTENKK
ncbi:MAG: helix-turn-helix transcriptional regulator [Lachnospiraceae bacterium]|nr:helix-turn-helix transcriptional regulator [Lachnospiraceae bacterium]